MRASTEVPPNVEETDVFSPLDLRDRVVIMAMFYEIAKVEQVEKAWHRWRALQGKGSNESLWRFLVSDAKVDQDALYEVAAQIYGFEEAEINRLRAQTLIRELTKTFKDAQWRRMFELLLAPIAVGEDPRTGHARLIFATHDPTRPEVTRMLQEFGIDSFELCYAAPSQIMELFTEIFGTEIEHLLFVQDPMLSEPPEDLQALVERDNGEAEATTDLDQRSLVDWFESVLVAACREKAAEAYIIINDTRELEIHLRIGEDLSLWRTEDAFHPEGLMVYVVEDILKVDRFEPGAVLSGRIRRWISSELTWFNVSVHPTGEQGKLDAGTIVLRVLGKE